MSKYNCLLKNRRINLQKKLIVLSFILLISIAALSGCVEETDPIIDNGKSSTNSCPVGIISAPDEAYFEETIVFDASDSYDTDGKIDYYLWDFGNGETSEGKIVEYAYKFENDFEINYPLIYPISLFVRDNNDSMVGTNHQIKIFPKEYRFYFDSGKIIFQNPSKDEDKIKATLGIIRKNNELIYELENPVNISSCTWNLTLHIKKPFLMNLRRISITLYDNNEAEISKTNFNFRILELWRDKSIEVEGKIDKKVEFKSVKISVFGFSILRKISILYGREEPSCICFSFLE